MILVMGKRANADLFTANAVFWFNMATLVFGFNVALLNTFANATTPKVDHGS